MKKIIIYPINHRVHNIHNHTIELLQKKYDLIYNPTKMSGWYKIKNNHLIRKTYYKIINTYRKIKKKKEKEVTTKNNLLFCCNSLPPEGKDFILDLEMITALNGYTIKNLNKTYIQKRLEDKTCKAIICWNKASYLSLTKTINCNNIKQKIHIIKFAEKATQRKKIPHKGTNILFVSSINNPHDFEGKGGIIALETYKELTKKHKNINFYVRANVKEEILQKYKNTPGLHIIKKFLSNKEMEELFDKTDFLLEPVPGIKLMLEMMANSIPTIGFNYWCIDEMIKNEKTGYKINGEKIFGTLQKNVTTYLKEMEKTKHKLSNKKKYQQYITIFAEKATKLINNKKKITQMSKEQKKLLEKNAEYSLIKRNKQLTTILDSTLR